jgi:hypothetical protein
LAVEPFAFGLIFMFPALICGELVGPSAAKGKLHPVRPIADAVF